MWDHEHGPALRQKSFNIEVKCGFYCKSKTNKFSKVKQTRKHSSRNAYFPLGNHTCTSFSGYHQTSLQGWGSPSEQVWTSLQWSLPDVTSRGSPGLMSRGGEGVPYLTFPGGYPTMGPISWCIWCYLPPPAPRAQTHTHLWKHYLPKT